MKVIVFRVGPYRLGLAVEEVVRCVLASEVKLDGGTYVVQNARWLPGDVLWPEVCRGEVVILCRFRTVPAGFRVDVVERVVDLADVVRYPMPTGWLEPGRRWITTVAFPDAQPVFVLNGTALAQALLQTLPDEVLACI